MQTDLEYYQEQARYYAATPALLVEATNRQLLRYEREEREELADMERMLKEQAGRERKWRHGHNLNIMYRWAKKTYALTVKAVKDRGYVWNGVKYVKGKLK